jgi:hypothetical protein
VPPAEAIQSAEAQLKEAHKDQLATATKGDARTALVEQFLRLANSTSATEDRFACFALATQLAVEAKDLPLALRAIAAWRDAFDLEPEATEKKAIGSIVELAKSQAERKETAMLLASTMDEQMLTEHYDVAHLLLDATLAMLTKMREPVMLKELKNREVEMKTWTKLWSEAHEAKATLAAMPDDAAANLTMGRYLCLVRNDWQAGSQHLIRGSDTLLQSAANKELAAPVSAEAQMELADAWWHIGDQEKDKSSVFPKIVWQDHAASWIRVALPELPAAARNKTQAKMTQLEKLHKSSNLLFAKRHPLDAEDTFAGHWYKFYHSQVSWKEAKAQCEAMGGRLVFIESKEEDDFVKSIILRHTEGIGDFNTWIGGSGEVAKGKYLWIDGSELAYTNWRPNHPSKIDGSDLYVAYWAGGGATQNMQWYTVPLRFRGFFVCEWSQ